MRNFQNTFETRKRLFISAFGICMTVRLKQGEKLGLSPRTWKPKDPWDL